MVWFIYAELAKALALSDVTDVPPTHLAWLTQNEYPVAIYALY